MCCSNNHAETVMMRPENINSPETKTWTKKSGRNDWNEIKKRKFGDPNAEMNGISRLLWSK